METILKLLLKEKKKKDVTHLLNLCVIVPTQNVAVQIGQIVGCSILENCSSKQNEWVIQVFCQRNMKAKVNKNK